MKVQHGIFVVVSQDLITRHLAFILTLCRTESSNQTIFLEVHRANHKLSLWLWKGILPFDSNKPDAQISRSVGWTRMQSHSCRFVGAVAAALNNTTTSYHIELKDLRTLLKHKLAGIV